MRGGNGSSIAVDRGAEGSVVGPYCQQLLDLQDGEKDEIRILLVEDNEGDAAYVRFLLEKPSMGRVPRAYWIRDLRYLGVGLQVARPHVVLLDLGLPGCCGLQAYDKVRSASMAAVVVLTGTGDDTSALEAVHRGAQDYLHKDNLDWQVLERAVLFAAERNRFRLAKRFAEDE